MSALRNMIEKLNNRQGGTSGYVTDAKELSEIMKELTPRVPVGIHDERHSMDYRHGSVTVSVKMSFTITLDELDEYEKLQAEKVNHE